MNADGPRPAARVKAPIAGVSSGKAMTEELSGATRATFNAMAFYDELETEQQLRLVLPFDDPGRTHWNFLPEAGRGQTGLPIKALSRYQELLLHRMVASALSLEGYARFLTALSLEHMLRELDTPRIGGLATDFRNPGNYYLTFFAAPQLDTTWGWRLVGHHVSLNFTVVGQELAFGTPALFGSQPGRVGPLRPLAMEEDVAFELLRSLSDGERQAAVIHPVAPPDFVGRCVPVLGAVELPATHGDGRRDVVITDVDREALRYERDTPRGLARGDMSKASRELFDRLVAIYTGRIAEPWDRHARERIEAAGSDALHFAWAGGLEYGLQHYYRLQGPVTLIEFVNSEDDANHVHSVWRDPERDFARDVLADGAGS